MNPSLRICLAQVDYLVGDIEGNTRALLQHAQEALAHGADLIVFPELTLTAYPPEDLLHRSSFHDCVNTAMDTLLEAELDIHMVIGYPERKPEGIYNSLAIIHKNKIIANYRKMHLPNYGVFDEKRYFIPGEIQQPFTIKQIKITPLVCEDLWYPEPIAQAKQQGAELILCCNASPFDLYKPHLREDIINQRIEETALPIAYVNWVGGQDELVFDGGSLCVNKKGKITHAAAYCEEALLMADFYDHDFKTTTKENDTSDEERLYKTLVLGVKDYVEKNNFPGVVLGLSGGIDSALTLAIACDALGADKVKAVLMPSCYTSHISVHDAKEQAETQGADYSIIPIELTRKAFEESLCDEFEGLDKDTTEENIQARIRGILLMAISNKTGKMLLTTGNKSETAVGYATLYGDMAGGFAPLKDVFKTMVYRLAHYRNSIKPVIPARVIERPPSAELAPDQKDQDSLPDYDTLDAILRQYIEEDQGMQSIIAQGFEADEVKRVISMVNRNEYKRRQAPPGVRISEKAFGRDRRYPITSGFGRHHQGK